MLCEFFFLLLFLNSRNIKNFRQNIWDKVFHCFINTHKYLYDVNLEYLEFFLQQKQEYKKGVKEVCSTINHGKNEQHFIFICVKMVTFFMKSLNFSHFIWFSFCWWRNASWKIYIHLFTKFSNVSHFKAFEWHLNISLHGLWINKSWIILKVENVKLKKMCLHY